jgi:CHAT domain-containing protein/Tfp pilus assembly protein PilF
MCCSGSHLSFELYSRVARISLAAALFLPAFLPAAFSQVAPAQVPPIQVAPAQAASAPQTASQVSLTTLEQGKAIEREISGKNADRYDLPLQAGQFAEISVEQRGIDVVIDTIDPDGKILAEFDSESRPQGEERVVVACGMAAAHYQLRVKPKYSRAPAGRYEIKLTATRAATEQDRLLSEAHVLSLQAEKSNDSGKYEDSLQLYTHALGDAEKALGPKDAYVGALLVKLGDIERTTDNRGKAEELYQRAITVDNAALGNENPQTAWAIDRLGTLYDWSDDYLRAEPLLTEGLNITEKTLGSDHPRLIQCLSELAVLYSNRYDHKRALQYLQRAQPIADKSLEPDDFMVILIMNNIANIYRLMENYDEAEVMTKRVVEMIEKQYGPDYPRLTTPLMNLGILARRKKDYAGSLQYLSRSLAIREKTLGARNSETARTIITIGNTYRAEGDYPKALENYSRAQDILQAVAGPYDVLLLLTYLNTAATYAASGDMPHAIEYEARLESMLEKSIELNVLIGSEQEKFDYLKDAAERTDRTISFSALLDPKNQTAADLAALDVLQRKGRLLDAISGTFDTFRRRLNSQDQLLLDEFAETTAKLAKLSLQGPEKMAPEEYQKQLSSLAEQREKLETDISRKSAEFRTQTEAVTLSGIKAAIPAPAALVEYAAYRPFNAKLDEEETAFGEPHYIAYVLHQQGDVQWRELGPAKEIDAAVASLRGALRDPKRKDAQQLARALDEKIMRPVRELVGDATQLLISPDGELNLIPFEALVDEKQHYLIESYSITYLTTGRDLLRLQAARSSRSRPVIIADPSFGEPESAPAAARKPVSQRTSHPLTARRNVTTAGDLSSIYFAPLPGTALEATAIKSQFPEAKLLTGKMATESAVKQISAPSTLHIATHGFFLADPKRASPENSSENTRGAHADFDVKNPLLRSGLALAGANLHQTGPERGILTALEASNLNLWGTKLVTLSACDTGVGEVRNGEGVYGLRRAFVLAGTESIVMSLWPVSDYTTREIMVSYYKGLKKGLGRGEALRQTKLAMLKRRDVQRPFYWASFIQSGEWASLDGKRD